MYCTTRALGATRQLHSLLRKQLEVWQEISPSTGVLEKTEGAQMTSPAVYVSRRQASLKHRGVGVTRQARKSLQSRKKLKTACVFQICLSHTLTVCKFKNFFIQRSYRNLEPNHSTYIGDTSVYVCMLFFLQRI